MERDDTTASDHDVAVGYLTKIGMVIALGAAAMVWAWYPLALPAPVVPTSTMAVAARASAPTLPAPAPAPSPTAAASAPSVVEAPPRKVVTELHVPRLPAPIVINANTQSKTAWDEEERGNTFEFKNTAGLNMNPYTQMKARWTGGSLYLLLYAADIDLNGHEKVHDRALDKDDSFHLEFERPSVTYTIDVSVLGTISDSVCTMSAGSRSCSPSWESRAVAAVDSDGTLNQIHDNDEEWAVEMSVPFASLAIEPKPGATFPLEVKRCEIAFDGVHQCGSWRGSVVLDP